MSPASRLLEICTNYYTFFLSGLKKNALTLKNLTTFEKAIVAFFFVFSVFNIATVTWGVSSYISWSIDDPSGMPILEFLAKHQIYLFHNYPPLLFVINGLLYLPVLFIYWLTGTLHPTLVYPYGFSNIGIQVGILIMITRTLNFLTYLLTGYFFYKGMHIVDKKIAFYGCFLYLLSPIIIQFSTLGNMDTPMMFFLSITFYFLARLYFLKPKETERPKYIYLLFLSFAFLCSTKEAGAVSFLLPFFILILKLSFYDHVRFKKIFVEFFKASLLFIFVYVLINNIVFHYSGFVSHLKFFLGKGVLAEISVPYDQITLLRKTLLAIFLTSPVIAVLSIFGILISLFQKRFRMFLFFLTPILGYYVLVLSRVETVVLRYTMPIVFYLALFAGTTLYQIDFLKKRFLRKVIVLVILASVVIPSLSPVYGKFTDSRYETREVLREVSHGKTVYALTTWMGEVANWMPNVSISYDLTKPSPFLNPNLTTMIHATNSSSNLYLVSYELYQRRNEVFKDLKVLYDSGEKGPYYYRADADLSACRISCRHLILSH